MISTFMSSNESENFCISKIYSINVKYYFSNTFYVTGLEVSINIKTEPTLNCYNFAKIQVTVSPLR